MDNKPVLIPALTSGEVDSLLKETLQRELEGWKKEGMLIRCLGSLMNLGARREVHEGRGSKLFGVTLDARGQLCMNAQKQLLADFEDGDYVEVICYPIVNIYQGSVNIRLEVIDAKLAESSDDQAQRRESHSTLAKIGSLKPTRNPFPLRTDVTLDIIFTRSGTAQVDSDFKNGLGDQSWRCLINAVPVRITSPEEVAQAIQESDADILAIIRGGGAETEFQVFNHDLVLQALAEKNSYRVVGIGHSANNTMVDLIADYSATVPAEAGAHIRGQLRHLADLTDQLEADLEESQDTVKHLQNEYDQFRQETKAEIDRLHESFQAQSQAPAQRSNIAHWVLIAALVAMICALTIAFLIPTFMENLQEWVLRLVS